MFGEKNSITQKIIKIAFSKSGHRLPEKVHLEKLMSLAPISMNDVKIDDWVGTLDQIPKSLETDLKYMGYLSENTSYQTELVGILLGV